MKTALLTTLLLTATICVSANLVLAQDRPSAAEQVENLKLQLIEIDAKQEIAKLQIQQLEEALKPENIERSLAGIGSTRPEELREQRRRELTMEKTVADAQLQQMVLQRSQLESALTNAQTQAYQESAGGSSFENAFMLTSIRPVWLLTGLAVCVAAALLITVSLLLRRNNRGTLQ